jgi:hypothetical protein
LIHSRIHIYANAILSCHRLFVGVGVKIFSRATVFQIYKFYPSVVVRYCHVVQLPPLLTNVTISSQRMLWATPVAVRIVFARDNEAISRNGITSLLIESRSEASHGGVPVLFATTYRVSLYVSFWIPMAYLVSVGGELFGYLRTFGKATLGG